MFLHRLLPASYHFYNFPASRHHSSKHSVNEALSQFTANSYHDDHFSGKPENVREFDRCQGKVRELTISQGIVGEKSFVEDDLFFTFCFGQHQC